MIEKALSKACDVVVLKREVQVQYITSSKTPHYVAIMIKPEPLR